MTGSSPGVQHLASETKPDIDPADAIVAATGLAFDETVVPNDSDFRDVDGFDVELYRSPSRFRYPGSSSVVGIGGASCLR